MLLTGNNIYKLDGKNRFFTPRALRKTGKRFFFTRGLDGCVLLYPEKEVRLDNHNRLLLPADAKKYAKIGKEIMLTEIARWWEIWSPEKFEKYRQDNRKTYEQYAEKLDIRI